MKKFFMIILIFLGVIIISTFGSEDDNTIEIMPKFKSGSDINILITSDIHYLSNNIRDNGQAFTKYNKNGDGKLLNYSEEIVDTLIYEVENNKTDILVISGDLTNNGEYESHIELSNKLKEIEALGTDVYVVPGNHDINNPYARGFLDDKQYKVDSITKKQFVELYNNFGYDEALMKDVGSSSYLAAPSEDLWLLMLDTTISDNNQRNNYPEVRGMVSENTLKWVEDCLQLAKEKGAKVIPVMHHNLLDHNEVIRDGFTIDNNADLLELLLDYKIEMTFSGHIHIQDIVSEKVEEKKIFDIASNSLAVYPNQYGVLQYSKDDGVKYNTKRLEVDKWAKSVGNENEDLLNFSEYSRMFLAEAGSRKSFLELEEMGYSDEDIKEAIEVLQKLNTYYFSGRENEITEEIRKTRGFDLLQNSDGFLKTYSSIISEDLNEGENNKLILGRSIVSDTPFMFSNFYIF